MTIILVSHDVGFISQYVNRVACLNQTLVCHETSCINGQVIDELYGTHVHMVEHVHS
jgi:zinc transport system ATP-binding protein